MEDQEAVDRGRNRLAAIPLQRQRQTIGSDGRHLWRVVVDDVAIRRKKRDITELPGIEAGRDMQRDLRVGRRGGGPEWIGQRQVRTVRR
jgi:hypothetical protein